MKIYNYDPITYEFLSSEDGILDPIDKLLMLPAYATSIKPLEKTQNKAICFNEADQVWYKITDNRNVDKWLNNNKVVFELGDEVSAEMTDTQFSDFELLQQAQAQKHSEIKSRYGVDIYADIEYADSIYSFPNGQQDINTMTTICSAGAYDDLAWYNAAGSGSITTITNLKKLLLSVNIRNQSLFEKLQTKQGSIDSSTTIDAVNNITWNEGE